MKNAFKRARRLGRTLRGDYNVPFAVDGAEALALVEGGQRFDAIATDVGMPVMDSRDMVARLVAMDPTTEGRVVVVTGGPEDRTLADWVDAWPPERTIRKPVGLDVFLATIRRVLDSPA